MRPPLLIRALAAFLALPVIVGGLGPWILLPNDRWRATGRVFGWPVLVFGVCVVLWTIRDFYVIGKGTLAPWDAPRKLVVVGLYRYMRNPMYVGVLGFVAGLSLLAGSPLLGAYTCVLAVGFHLRVVLHEERVLAHKFPADWAQYRRTVNRWLPKVPARYGDVRRTH